MSARSSIVWASWKGPLLRRYAEAIEVAFWFTKRDEYPRFSKIETTATNAHVHRAKTRNLDEGLADRVRRWIDAYRVCGREHLR